MTLAGSMEDMLAGSSLVVAIIAALLTLWQAEISTALAMTVPRDPANRGAAKSAVSAVLFRMLLPLSLTAATAASILVPRAVVLMGGTYSCIKRGASSCHYDDVGGLFLMTETLLFLLLAIIGAQLKAAFAKLSALNAR